MPRWRFRWLLARSRLNQSLGDFDGALALLDEAERHYVRGPVPDVHPIPAMKARVWAAQGRVRESLEWAQAQSLANDNDLSYAREFEHLTLARVLLAQGREPGAAAHASREAIRLLERLRAAAESGGRTGSLIETLLLMALAHEAEGDRPAAREALDHALRLAEPEGYARIFADEGAPMARLLGDAAARGSQVGYTGRLLALIEPERRASVGTATPAAQPLAEPLSERELAALRLFDEGLSNREMAERLFLALPTIKALNRTLFAKLQVNRRTEAVARARELGLL
jgi:LuxR family maltose regulon positive regulatory protein